MNLANIKRLVLPFLAVALFSSCDKPVTSDQLGDDGQQLIRVVDYGGTGANFNNSALILDPTSTAETVEFRLEFIGAKVPTQDLTITVGVNDAARVTYNADPANSPYDPLPAGFYTLNTTTATIKAGEVFSTPLSVTFDPSQFDESISYMLPISILSVSGGSNIVGGPSTGTAYFHIIGNPLAGTYNVEGYVYHPSLPRDLVPPYDVKVLSPLSSTVLLHEFGDLGGSGYVGTLETDMQTNKVTIKAAPGAANAPYTQFDDGLPSTFPGYTPPGPPELWTAAKSAQCNNTYDPATKTFKIRYGYLNATSGWRVTEEILVKQ